MPAKPKKTVLDVKSRVAKRLKTAREDLSLTQQQVADQARISRSAIVHYEKGNVIPGGPELIRLAKTLKITPNYILSGTETFFDSPAREHTLAASETDKAIQIARLSVCMQVLDREVAEAVSALVMALVKAKVPKKDYPVFIEMLDGVGETMGGFTPEMKAMVEKKDAAGAFDHIKKMPRKRKK